MDVLSRQGRGDLLNDGLLGAGFVKRLGLHNAGAHGGHLRTEARADDGGHQVAAEGRAGHLEVGVFLKLGVVHIDVRGFAQEVLVLLDIDIEVGAVGGQAGVQAGRAARAKVAAEVGRADEDDLGLFVHDEIAQGLGVAVGGVVLQQRAVDVKDAVGAVAAEGLDVTFVDLAAHDKRRTVRRRGRWRACGLR